MKLTLVSTMLLMGSVEVTLSNRRTHIIRPSPRAAPSLKSDVRFLPGANPYNWEYSTPDLFLGR
jgi:hypothetical protein